MRLNRLGLDRRDLAASVGLIVLAVVFFHNAIIGGEQFYAGDTSRYFYPLKKMVADSVRGGLAPVWNPLVHSGMPLHAALQGGVFYPFSLLFYLLPFDFAYKWYIVIHVLIAAFGTYLLMRRWQVKVIPAFFAGTTYAFSGYVISFIDGLNIFSSIVWLPVVFLLIEWAVENPRILSIISASSAVAVQTLAGDPVSGYYTFAICGAYWLILVVRSSALRRPRAETLAKVSTLPIIVGLAFLLSYAQIGPSQELTRYTTRADSISYESATNHSLAPLRLTTLAVPYLFGNSLEDVYDWGRIFAPHFPLVRALYLGALPLLLIPLALLVFKDRRVYFFAGVLIISLLLSLGKYTPVYGLAHAILPLFSKFRFPFKAFFLTTFAMAVLAGYGLDCLLSGDPAERHHVRANAQRMVRRYLLLLLVVTGIWLAFALCDRFLIDLSDRFFLRASSADAALTRRFILYMKQQMIHGSILFAVLAGSLWIWQRRILSRRLFAFVVLACTAVDLLPVSYRAMDTTAESFYMPPRIHSKLRADRDFFRLYRTPLDLEQHVGGLNLRTPADYAAWTRELLSPNFGTLFGYGYTDGYESANLAWHNRFIKFIESSPPIIRPRLLGLLNVKYIFSSSPVNHPDLELESTPAENVFVYENTLCLDRAYFVPISIVASTETVALKLLASNMFNPYEAVVLVDKGGPGSINPRPESGGFEVAMPPDFSFQKMDVAGDFRTGRRPEIQEAPNRVKITDYSAGSATLSVDAPSDGYVVLCDAYYPRWRAYVNGKETRILRADGTVRAVPVSRGSSTIEFIYDTTFFRRAAFVSLVVLLVCIGAAAFDIFFRPFRRNER